MSNEVGFVRRRGWCSHLWRILDGRKADCFKCQSSFPYAVPVAIEQDGARLCSHRVIIVERVREQGEWRHGKCRKCHERFPLDGFDDQIRLLASTKVCREPKKEPPLRWSPVGILFPVALLALAAFITLLRFLFPEGSECSLAIVAVVFLWCLAVVWHLYKLARFYRGE